MAVAFQFHRINLPPLHLSYVTFGVLAVILLPSPNKDSDYSGKQCYDLGTISVNAEIEDNWYSFDDVSIKLPDDLPSNSTNDRDDMIRYVNRILSTK